ERVAALPAQPLGPERERLARGIAKPLGLLRGHPGRAPEGREPGAVQDLVGVRVPDSAEEPWIGERALERVVLAAERLPELRRISLQHFEAARIERPQSGLALDDMQRRAFSRAGLGEDERPRGKLEARERP